MSSSDKLVAQVVSTLVMIVVAITLLKELSIQSELIRSLSFLFFLTIVAAVIAIAVKIFDYFR
ncbi:MAG: hypothetical protein Q8Q01_05050 [archaeon]|nr:hypothetical protein [archaeon]